MAVTAIPIACYCRVRDYDPLSDTHSPLEDPEARAVRHTFYQPLVEMFFADRRLLANRWFMRDFTDDLDSSGVESTGQRHGHVENLVVARPVRCDRTRATRPVLSCTTTRCASAGRPARTPKWPESRSCRPRTPCNGAPARVRARSYLIAATPIFTSSSRRGRAPVRPDRQASPCRYRNADEHNPHQHIASDRARRGGGECFSRNAFTRRKNSES